MLVKPKVKLIARTKLDRQAAREWLDDLGAEEFPVPGEDQNDGAALVMLAGKRCYKSFHPKLNPNLTRVRSDMARFITNILRTGHGSVLEHVYFTFAIEGVSRVLTGELNRHRAGAAISEGSQRYIRFDHDIDYWIPHSIQENDADSEELKAKKAATRLIFRQAFIQSAQVYKELEEIWEEELKTNFDTKKKLTSLFRRVMPMGSATGGVWTWNIRALRHIFTMRLSAAAEEEITEVACQALRIMQEEEPECFRDFDFDDDKSEWRPKYQKV